MALSSHCVNTEREEPKQILVLSRAEEIEIEVLGG